MAKSNSFVAVSMVGAVALVVLLSPNMNFDDNVAGQASSFEKDYKALSVYEKDSAEKELVAIDVIAAEYYEEESKIVAAESKTITSSYIEEPKLELASDETIETILDGEGVSDGPDGSIGTAQSEPATIIIGGEPITVIGTSESATPEEPPAVEGGETIMGGTRACLDSDGDVLTTVGSTTGPDRRGTWQTHTDYCDSSGRVVEGTCHIRRDGTSEIRTRSRNCRGGLVCIDGACVPS